MNAAQKRIDEFRRLLAAARERELRAAKLTDEEIATSEPHQPGSAWDEASTQSAVDTLAQLEGRQRHALDEIGAAQARLEAGTYGACETCGRPIALARLRAVPAARLCATCQARTEPAAARRRRPPNSPAKAVSARRQPKTMTRKARSRRKPTPTPKRKKR